MQPGLTGSELAEHLAQAFLSRIWSSDHDLDAIDEVMNEDYKVTSAGKVVSGRSNFKAWVSAFQSRMPGARIEVFDVFANSSGDRVACRWICSGTNNGMFGCPPDGEPFSFSGLSIWAIRDGKLAECWVERSGLEAYLQLSGNK